MGCISAKDNFNNERQNLNNQYVSERGNVLLLHERKNKTLYFYVIEVWYDGKKYGFCPKFFENGDVEERLLAIYEEVSPGKYAFSDANVDFDYTKWLPFVSNQRRKSINELNERQAVNHYKNMFELLRGDIVCIKN